MTALQADEFDAALQSEVDRRKAWVLEEEERRRRMKEGKQEDAAHTTLLREISKVVNAKVAHHIKAKKQKE